MTDNDNLVTNDDIQTAVANIVQRVQSGVDSVSVVVAPFSSFLLGH